jgi:soluble lytic murein transglycosylase
MQFSAILTLIPLLAGLIFPLPASAQNKGDDTILEIHQAFKKGDKKRVASLLPMAGGHRLEPWAAYWDMKLRLDAATPAEVQDFLAKYAGSYQEDRLRNDWLLLLGQRRDWTNFAAEYPNYRMGDDKEVRCYALATENALAGLATPEMTTQLKTLWYALRDTDDGCTYLAGKLFTARKLTEAEIWRKARLAMDNNRPRAARAAVEIVSSEAAASIGEIQDAPARYLSKRVVAASRTSRELVVLAIIRMANSDADATAAVLENHWSVHLSPEQRSWAWGAVGKASAQRLANDALDHFAKAAHKDLNDDQLGWRTRAALRRANWREVLTTTSAMGDEARQDATWVYWRARAQIKLAKTESQQEEAKAALQGIASGRGFYEQLALEELGQRITAPEKPAELTPEEKDAAQKNAGLARALHAIQIGLRPEGVREWNYSTNLHAKGGMGDRELLAAADLACQRLVWDRCINTSERTKTLIDIDQRYPMPFKEAVVARARQIELDPAYVYGLIRQESRFIMDARSHVGASGLMQVMPATARWTAKRIGLNDFKAGDINDRDTNIAIGTGYLKLVLDDFGGSMPLAAAAYNAGPSRPRNWRGQNGAPVVEAAIWAENVPFAETRDYVKKVLANTTTYAAIISGKSQSLKARLGAIGPRDTQAPAPNTELP